MVHAKRERRERTDNWELIQQWCSYPEQQLYESIPAAEGQCGGERED